MITGLPQASSDAARIDILFHAMLALSAVVCVGVLVAIVWFGIKYRRGSKADRSGRERRNLGIEATWTLIPLLLFMAIFAWSIKLWADLRTPPANAQPIYVVARQWMWKVQHVGGQREINTLHVPVGHPIRLVMTSQDVIHSFYVPAFRVKQDVLPDRYTTLSFTPTRAGEYELFCAEYCGTQHSVMRGRVVVQPPAIHARWLQSHARQGLASQGAQLYRAMGCSGCHQPGASVHAPDLHGIAGRSIAMADGSTRVADDGYLRDSILLPRKDVVAGYQPIMPSYQGRLDPEDVLALIAYLKRSDPADGPEQPSP